MSTSHSLLAFSIKDYINYLPLAVAILCGVILFIALCIGFAKGARKVRYGGVAWLIAGVGYIFADKFLRAKNPLNKLLSGRFSAKVVEFASSFSIALACILIVLILGGIFSLFLRPKKKKEKKRKENLDTIGVSYDEISSTKYSIKRRRKKKKRKANPPSLVDFWADLRALSTAL